MTTLDEDPPAAQETDGEAVSPTIDVPVSAHYCSPERTVFTEEGNSDAWIATDVTVALER